MFAGNQLRQVFALLRLVTVAADLVDAEGGMGAVRQPDRSRRPRHFFDCDTVLEIAQTSAAIFLFDGDAVQAERAHLRPEVARKLVAPVDFGGARRDLVAREGIDGLANRIRGFAEIEIEHPVRVGNHGGAASGTSIRLYGPQPYSPGMRLSR